MSRFNELLLEADSRLGVAEPARSRILLELAADMDGLFEEVLARGVSEEEAEIQVAEHFDLSDETLRELLKVHDTPLQRSLGGFVGQVQGPGSRALILLLALFVVLVSGTLLLRSELYRDASELVWVLLPLLALGVVWAGGRAATLLRPGDRWKRDLAGGSSRILTLALFIPALAVAGLWVQLYISAVRIRGAPQEAMVLLVGWIHMASATLTVAISSALFLAFLWFLLESRARRMAERALAQLLGGSS